MKNEIEVDGIKYTRAGPDRNTDGLRYAVVRSREQGVMSGYVQSIDGRAVTLHDARQLWQWHSALSLADLAEFGPDAAEKCRFSATMSEPALMLEACGVLYCSTAGGDAIRAVKAHNA